MSDALPNPLPAAPETLLAFPRFIPDEATAVQYVIQARWPDGFRCPTCGVGKYALTKRGEMKCPNNHFTSPTAGTVMHRSKQPLQTWLYAIYLVSTLTPGISAVQLQKELGIANYEPAFNMLHKIRSALVAPGREPLHGAVEVDELFVGGKEEGRPGRGAESKALVICAVERREYVKEDRDDPSLGVGKLRAGRARMSIIPNANAETLLTWVQSNIAPGSTVFTDGWAGYAGLTTLGYKHRRVLQSHKGKKTGHYLPLVHLLISNLKRWLIGTYKGAWRRQHLQAYLNEYIFRFNRRFWQGPAFMRALRLICTAESWPEYKTLYGTAANKPRWVHPDTRAVSTDERMAEAVFVSLRMAADASLQVWMDEQKDAVLRQIRRALEQAETVKLKSEV